MPRSSFAFAFLLLLPASCASPGDQEEVAPVKVAVKLTAERLLAHDQWAMTHGERAAGPFVLRFRTPVLQAGETGTHLHRVSVLWPYAVEGTKAMPSPADSKQMGVFEERLCKAWEQGADAVLVAVLTFDGARQWVFYARDVGLCAKRISEMPQEKERYPIELTTERDPDWAWLRDELLAMVRWKELQSNWRQALNEKK